MDFLCIRQFGRTRVVAHIMGLVVLLLVSSTTTVTADETCQSPYLPKITGQDLRSAG